MRRLGIKESAAASNANQRAGNVDRLAFGRIFRVGEINHIQKVLPHPKVSRCRISGKQRAFFMEPPSLRAHIESGAGGKDFANFLTIRLDRIIGQQADFFGLLNVKGY